MQVIDTEKKVGTLGIGRRQFIGKLELEVAGQTSYCAAGHKAHLPPRTAAHYQRYVQIYAIGVQATHFGEAQTFVHQMELFMFSKKKNMTWEHKNVTGDRHRKQRKFKQKFEDF